MTWMAREEDEMPIPPNEWSSESQKKGEEDEMLNQQVPGMIVRDVLGPLVT